MLMLNAQNKELSDIDTSIFDIQEKAKLKIRSFKSANDKQQDIEERKRRIKWKGYSIANDLAEKMNAKDWKLNPKYNKFIRSVNKNGPLR